MIKKDSILYKTHNKIKGRYVLFFGIITVVLLLYLFIIYPLYSTFKLSITGNGRFTLDIYRYIFSQKRYQHAITNSILLGITVASLSTIIGFLFAYSTKRVFIGFNSFFQSIAILPLISPPFMFALSAILLFGRNGLISAKLLGYDSLGIYGFKGLIIVQTLSMFPIAFLTLSGIIQTIDPDLEASAMNLGAKRVHVFRTITLPLSFPGLLASWLLVFVGSLTDFGNPIIIGGDFNVLSVQAYLEFTGMGNLARGTALAVLLLIPTVFVFLIQKRVLNGRIYVGITGKSSRKIMLLTSPIAKKVLFLICVILSIFIIFIYLTIICGSFITLWGVDWTLTLDHFIYSYDVGLRTLITTLFLAIVSTPITVFIGVFIAFITVRMKFRGRHIIEFVSMLSYAIPGTVVGIGYILAFNKSPFKLSGTAFILIAAYIFRNIPIGVKGGIAALQQISPDIEESSTNLGADDGYTFRKVTIPLIKPSLFAVATFAFIRSMTAISAIIFLTSARWNHLSVLILAQTEIMRLGAASVMSFLLIVVNIIFIFLITKISGLTRSQFLKSAR